MVYVGCDDGKLYAMDAQSGQGTGRSFGVLHLGCGVWSSPSISGRAVYVGSQDSLYALDNASGKELWKFKTGRVLISSPAISDGVVYFGGDDGYLYAVK